MVFNLREAGTEVYEGTTEWHSRIEREVATMRYRIPPTIRTNSSDSLESSDAYNDSEVESEAPDDTSAWDLHYISRVI